MKFFPYESFSLETRLTQAEIIDRLESKIEPKDYFRWNGMWGSKKTHQPYEGRIVGNWFRISRIIGYRNSFLPVIDGRIAQVVNGSRIYVRMYMHPFVTVFMALWLGSTGVTAIGLAVRYYRKDLGLFIEPAPLLMFLFGYTLMTVAFKAESSPSKRFLANLFEVEQTPINLGGGDFTNYQKE